MQYPVSIRNIRQLKAGDLIEYSGRVMLVNESTIERYRLYEKLEGAPLLNLSREILFFCEPIEGGFNVESFDIDPEDLEYLFMSGVTATVGLNVYEDSILDIYRRFSRVNFSVCNKKLLIPLDEQQKVPDEIECGLSVSLKDVLLLVNVSSNGDRFGSDFDA